MTHEDVAMEFMTRFCGGDVDNLEALLTENLQFIGPFHTRSDRQSYQEAH